MKKQENAGRLWQACGQLLKAEIWFCSLPSKLSLAKLPSSKPWNNFYHSAIQPSSQSSALNQTLLFIMRMAEWLGNYINHKERTEDEQCCYSKFAIARHLWFEMDMHSESGTRERERENKRSEHSKASERGREFGRFEAKDLKWVNTNPFKHLWMIVCFGKTS